MKLNDLQNLFFKTITRYEDQAESEKCIQSSEKLSPEDRLFIYQNAYRLRLQDAIIDDFEVSRELLGEEKFENLFKKFCDTRYSNYKTLNGFTKAWLEFLTTQDIDPQILDLARFEWNMIHSFYSHIADNPFYPEFILSENPRAAIRLDNSVCIMESDWPLLSTFETKSLQNKNKSYIVLWTENNPIYYRTVNTKEFLLIRLLQQEKSMDEIFLKLGELGLSDEELAPFLQSSIANFMKYGFLRKS